MQREQVCRVEMDMLRILRTQKHGNIALDGGEREEKMVERREMRGQSVVALISGPRHALLRWARD